MKVISYLTPLCYPFPCVRGFLESGIRRNHHFFSSKRSRAELSIFDEGIQDVLTIGCSCQEIKVNQTLIFAFAYDQGLKHSKANYLFCYISYVVS